ncbi:glycosyltransferase [Pantoea sp. B65]|uniref:glycosyltransferase n=1 Tax=Pantoea sp. B65 TaxID=2813359 RepID=UPI0039B44267
MPPLLSVIIPVYNVADYLEECLTSVVNQSLNDMEIIIVNDGSTDNSQTIIDIFSKNDARVIALQQANAGLSAARNYGLRVASGKYVAFLDSDDWVELSAYETMVNHAIAKDDDIVSCGFYLEYPQTQRAVIPPRLESQSPQASYPLYRHIKVGAWDKVYKRELFTRNGICYPEGLWFEDTPTTLPLIFSAKRVSLLDAALIHYRQREGSITKQAELNPKIFDLFTGMDIVKRYIPESNTRIFNDVYQYLYIKKCVIDTYIRLARFNQQQTYSSFIRQEYRKRFSFFSGNKLLTLKETLTAILILYAPDVVKKVTLDKLLRK